MGLLTRIFEREPRLAENLFLVPNSTGGYSLFNLHGMKNKPLILKNLRRIGKRKAIRNYIDRRIRNGTFYRKPK